MRHKNQNWNMPDPATWDAARLADGKPVGTPKAGNVLAIYPKREDR